MKKYSQLLFMACISALIFSTAVSAQKRRLGGGKDSASMQQRAYRQQLQAKYDSLSPEQKKEIRAKMRSRMDDLTPEQRTAMKEKMKARIDSLPPEKKKELRKAFREKYKGLTPGEKQKLREDVLKGADSAGQAPVRKRKPVVD